MYIISICSYSHYPCLQQLLIWWVPNGDFFLVPLFLPFSWNFTIRKSCSSLLIYLLTSFFASLVYSVGYNPLLLLVFCCSNCPTVGLWECILAPVLFGHAPIFFWTLIYFQTPQRIIPSSVFIFFYTRLGISYFSRELWFFLLKNGI